MRSGFSQFPIASELFLDMAKHGNAVPKCPIKPGHYHMAAFAIDSSPVTRFLPIGEYFILYQVFDENRKSSQVINLEFHIKKH
jgi:Protein of unknown function (DUF1091)